MRVWGSDYVGSKLGDYWREDFLKFQPEVTLDYNLAATAAGPYVDLTIENLHNRTYPLSQNYYVYLDRAPGKPLDPKVREFMRYILSREGQAAIARHGKYLPLAEDAVRAELKKLD